MKSIRGTTQRAAISAPNDQGRSTLLHLAGNDILSRWGNRGTKEQRLPSYLDTLVMLAWHV